MVRKFVFLLFAVFFYPLTACAQETEKSVEPTVENPQPESSRPKEPSLTPNLYLTFFAYRLDVEVVTLFPVSEIKDEDPIKAVVQAFDFLSVYGPKDKDIYRDADFPVTGKTI